MLVQEATAEESDAYSDTTQAEPEAADTAATELDTEAGAEGVTGTTVVVLLSIDEDVETAGRVVFTRVVCEMEGVALGTVETELVATSVVDATPV